MFCHRFYMRQSHAKNDWQTVATACMFLASKVEDNLRPLRDVVLVAYELVYKWDPSASERIKRREVYYKQKELILVAENLLLVTIDFDMAIQHPFSPLVGALKRLKISNNEVAKAAWNLVNEWLRTTLCLQYKPHYIAAGSLSVAAKLINFKLPMVDGKAWWLQFDVSPKQLEEVTQQMLRYFKHDEKQKVPKVPTDVIKPSTLKAENSTSQSAQSRLTVESGLEEKAAPVAREQKPQTYKYGLKGIVESNHLPVKVASEHQSSDCSGVSSVIDCETVDTSSKTARGDDALGNIDLDRLKGAFERTRRVKCAKYKAVAVTESDLDGDLLIESELEKGVELEYVAASKRQKVLQE
ncbi:cyclin-T1-3-like [Chenopodium quinoa]|uniref:cyclin-T1-3-like n=1 Tax=Chenopodium quinoa TaxID=63459 RepID=UPI000B77B99E|nr:cyclin-T1-3-like [Chenopodium quinoa]